MSITMYAYAATAADESDPDELFNIEAADPDAVMTQHFPNARLSFKHEDEGQFVYDVIEGDDTIAVLYASDDITPADYTDELLNVMSVDDDAPKKPKARPAKKATNAAELSTKDVAEKVGTDPKTLRVFLRASKDYNAVGSGARYSFTAKDIPTMKTRFNKWEKERAAARKAKADERDAKALADAAEKVADVTPA